MHDNFYSQHPQRRRRRWPVPGHWQGAHRLLALLLVLAGALFVGARPAYAAAITADGTDCTLIEAITSANNDNAAGNGCANGSGADTITLTADVTLTVVNNGTIFNTGPNGLPTITSVITIAGEGHTIARSTAGGIPNFRHLYVAASGNLTLNRVTLTGGTGGAITNEGTLTINNSTLSGNSGSTITNAGTFSLNSSTVTGNNGGGTGGGLYNLGTATLNRSLISGNTATSGAEIYRQNGTITANNANLFGDSSKTNAQAFSGFTPGATDITATSNGTTPTALASILNTTLTNNDGALTHALVAGSPALDAAGDSGLDTDQRGVTRPQGSADDIGAFELAVAAPSGGAALDFDGSNDYITLPALNLNSNTVTFEAWIYPDGGQPDYATLLKTPSGNVVTILWLPGGKLGYQWDGAYWNVDTGLTIPLNQWSHIAVAVAPDKAILYLNGVAFTNTATHVVKAFDAPTTLGTDLDNAGRAFKGRMDEVRIWNRTLAASEIAANRNCELGSTPTGLVARYNFNQGVAAADNSSVTTLTDGSGNAYDGTLTNFTLSGASSNWIEPGSTASGTPCVDRPKIDVQGNSVSIANGDSTPAATDHTDFGKVAEESGTVVRTFTIRNVGAAALSLSGTPLVSINGNSAFTVSSQPASNNLAAGGSTTFQVTFAPNGSGAVTATVSIASTDSDETPYTFVVQGVRTGSNVALGKPASQSSTIGSDCAVAAKAVDGNTSGNWNDCTVSHTDNNAQAWWQVDLQAPYLIDMVEIWNRTDCCNTGLSNFDLLLSTDGTTWTSFYHPGTVATSTSFVVNTVARYVKIQLRGSNYLILAEVQVWGPALPDIDVQGNSVSIANGDSTPTAADHTDFGKVAEESGTVVRTFTIRNVGAAALSLSGTPLVSISGDSAFTVSSQPASNNLAAGGSTTFQVTFAPNGSGVVTATVSIANDDSDETPYTFVVQGVRTGSNVALGKPASQSSTYASDCAVAAKAVDGNTSGNWSDCTVAHTNNDSQAWWQVDLQAPYLIDMVEIWNRTDCCNAGLSNFDLLLSTDGTTWTSFYYPGTVSTNASFVVNTVARYVKIQLRGQNYLTLAEVQVWGPALPDIDVQGNGVSIDNGDSTPAAADHTAFGNLSTSKLLTRTFTIDNLGIAALTSVAVTVNGDSAFSLTSPPATNVTPGGSSSFVITFDPSSVGVVTATVQIASNDNDENPYTFVISGEGVAPYADVTIVLDTRPNSPANLAFRGNFGAFMLDDPTADDRDAYSNRKTFQVAPGSYTVSRNAADIWFVSAIACTPASGATINLAQRSATLTLADGDNVTCTFTVDRAVTIRARVFNDLVRRTTNLGKRNAGDPWLNGWTMQASTAPTATVVSRMTQATGTDGLYEALFEYLRPGAYTLCAVLPAATWTPTAPSALDPVYGKPCKTVTLTPGQAATVLFGAYETTVAASETVTPEEELITDDDSIVEIPYDPAEDETATAEDGRLRLFLPLVQR